MRLGCLFFLIVSSLLSAATSWATPNSQLTPVRLQLKWYHQFQFAGYYAAAEKGYFRDAGLDVSLLEASPSVEVGNALLSGSADFGVDSTGILARRSRGEPFVVLAAIFQHSPSVFLALKSSGLRTPQDLIGKRLMTAGFDDLELRAMMTSEGVLPGKYQDVPHTWNLDDLIDGRVDAISAYLTNEPFQLKQRGIETTTIRSLQYGLDFYGDCIYTTERYLAGHPEQVEQFLHASRKGWLYAFEHTDEVIGIILDKYKSHKSRDQLRFEAEALRELVLPREIEIGHMSRGRWEHIKATYSGQKAISQDVDLSKFLYTEIQDTEAQSTQKKLRWALALLALLWVCGAGALAWVVLLRRTVERRTLELVKSEAKYRKLYENMHDGFVSTDMNGRFQECNSAYSELVGYSIEELRTLTYPQLTPSEFHIQEQKIVDEIIREGFSPLYEKQYIRKNGEVISVEIRVLLTYDDSGRPSGMWGIVRDITSRKKQEEDLRFAKEQAEAAARVKSEFLARMSHELRTPLNAVIGISELWGLNHLDSQQRSLQKDLQRAASVLLATVNDILDFSRMELSPLRLERVPFSVRHVIEEVVSLFQREAHRKGLKLETEIASSVPDHIQGDPFRLRQILTNLVSNALKFTSTGSVTLHCQPGSVINFLCFEVRDTGVGMAPEIVNTVFDPFVQGEDSVARKYGGTGLGLAICRKLVGLMGGEIHATSILGQGSTFRFSIATSYGGQE